MRHILGGSVYFLGTLGEAVKQNAAAVKALNGLKKIELFDGVKKMDEAQWKKLCSGLKAVDKAYVEFIGALSDAELASPMKIDWYKGKPAEVPLWFMMEQFITHNLHHRGQVSQILDTLKIENDYSGINVKFL